MKKLSPGQIEQIQMATEQILERVGVQVWHEPILNKARRAGAAVDETSGTVRFPAPLLRELLSSVPRQYSVCGVNGKKLLIGGGEQSCLAIVTDPWIVDYATQLPRRPVLEDVRRHSIIAQELEPVVMVSRMDYPVADVPGPASSLRALEIHLLHHAKHNYVLPATLESYREWLEILGNLEQSTGLAQNLLMTVGIPVLSPLRLTEMNAQIMWDACSRGQPIVSTICPMAGTTGPYTMAGTLLIGNAENMFLAALTQVLRPGNPYLYAMGPSRMDMGTGGNLYYTLDKVLWKIAAAQLGHSYGMPVAAECGGTMTYRYDQQSGAEGMLFMLAACESKADLLSGIGSCFNAVGMSAEMMVIQTAWLEAAKYLGRGIDLETLDQSLESIRRVGPGGHFMTDDLTMARLRAGEFFDSDIFDLTGVYGPHPSLLERAHQKVEEMISRQPTPVPDRVKEVLRRYFRDRYKKLAAG